MPEKKLLYNIDSVIDSLEISRREMAEFSRAVIRINGLVKVGAGATLMVESATIEFGPEGGIVSAGVVYAHDSTFKPQSGTEDWRGITLAGTAAAASVFEKCTFVSGGAICKDDNPDFFKKFADPTLDEDEENALVRRQSGDTIGVDYDDLDVFRKGGAICLFMTGGREITVKGCQFENCRAQYGGAISINMSRAALIDCAFVGCSAEFDGGAIYVELCREGFSASDSRFINCDAGGDGGALCICDSPFSFKSCSFKGCSASESGGAVRYHKEELYGCFKDCVFEECSSNYQAGGGLYLLGTSADLSNCVFNACQAANEPGGGLFIEEATIRPAGVIFQNCSAKRGGGGAAFRVSKMRTPDFGGCEFMNCSPDNACDAATLPLENLGSGGEELEGAKILEQFHPRRVNVPPVPSGIMKDVPLARYFGYAVCIIFGMMTGVFTVMYLEQILGQSDFIAFLGLSTAIAGGITGKYVGDRVCMSCSGFLTWFVFFMVFMGIMGSEGPDPKISFSMLTCCWIGYVGGYYIVDITQKK